MVTASEGRLSLTITRPFSRPASAPAINTSTITTGIGKPMCHSTPISALDAPSTDATERSISAATIISVIGSAINAISVRSARMLLTFAPVRNTGDNKRPSTSDRASTMTSNTSHCNGVSRLRVSSAESGLAMIAFPHHAFGDGAGQQSIGGNRGDNQCALDRLLPEWRDVQHDERDADHTQHERAERGAKNGAHSTGDRHAAHHGGGNDLQFDALRGACIDGAEAREPQCTRETGNRAGQQKTRRHATFDVHAGKPRRLRIRADCIVFASAAKLLQIDSQTGEHDDRDQRERRYAEES